MTPIRKSADGEDCQLRIPNVCRGGTSVLCHLNGGGWGGKNLDIHGAYGCQDCHSWVDGGYARDKDATRLLRDLYHLEAVIRTQCILVDKGLIEFQNLKKR